MFFLSTAAAMGAEEWQKTCFQPENSYFTLFSPKKTSVQGLTQYRIWFYPWNVLSQHCRCYGGRGIAKNMFSAWKQLIQTLFPTNNISTRLNPMQNLILSMECSFTALWLLWGPRNGRKPVFSLKTAISHSFPPKNISTRLNPIRNLILSMQCSFLAPWLLWGPRNGQKPVFGLKTAISHSFYHQ